MAACNQGTIASQSEEVLLEKRYGGIASKKPLISKDHERSYFDSADWVLGKQGTSAKSNTAVESLKPKLKRTPHHQLPPRRPACTTGLENAE
ncbi:uncharacterized protein LOC121989480 [Zingiber officinale]|uniref:uncharacterized protein LOC121989480 n=1 Tax=Zingiber officinale TaxID=94328 RepID=UPI001C4A96D5|nr:uncharacterized protein LOC121989480 [Zingiber officinale]